MLQFNNCEAQRVTGAENCYEVWRWTAMRTFSAIVEKCPDTGLYVGYVPGFPGAHTQAATLDELQRNLREVIEMLIEDGEPLLESEFIGTQMVVIS